MLNPIYKAIADTEKVRAFVEFYLREVIKEKSISRKFVEFFVKQIFRENFLLEQICSNSVEDLKNGRSNVFHNSKAIYRMYFDARTSDGKEITKLPSSPREELIAKLQSMSDYEFAQIRPELEKINLLSIVDDKTERAVAISRKVVDAKSGIKVDLSDLDLKERAAFFDAIYSRRTSFKVECAGKSKGFILDWIDKEFPERKIWHMTQADLGNLDRDAWKKLQIWKRNNAISADFGLPEKKNRQVSADSTSTPLTGKKLFAKLRRGEPVRPSEVRRYDRERKQASKPVR